MATTPPPPSPIDGAPLFSVPADLVAAHPQLAEFADRMRIVQQAPGNRNHWQTWPDGGLTCDGGALAAALVARDLAIPVRLCVGLYWHTDATLRAELMGEHPDGDDDPAWVETLATIESRFMDEHHHWVVLWPHGPNPVLVDPNGPCRREPYAQLVHDRLWHPTSWERHTYGELPVGDPDRVLMYDPDDDWDDIADDLYPGLRATVATTS